MNALRKLFSTKKRIVLALLAIIVMIFIGRSVFFNSSKDASSFTLVKRGDIKSELTLSGQIDAEDHAILTFGVAGKVNWVGVKEGEWVKKGQEIANLDAEVLDAALRQARQNYTAAEASAQKYYDGRDSNAVESYDDKVKRTTIDAAKNVAFDNIRIAQKNLESASLSSPIEGLVVVANPDLTGVNVTALSSNYEIVNPSTVYLKVTADQTEVGNIRKGQEGIITFDSYPDEKITGKIKEISFVPDKNEAGTVYDAKVILTDIDNSSYKYRLGMTADIDFVIKESKSVLVVPTEYVKSDNKGKYVLAGKDKKKTYVETGIENDTNVEITEGLSEGDVVYD